MMSLSLSLSLVLFVVPTAAFVTRSLDPFLNQISSGSRVFRAKNSYLCAQTAAEASPTRVRVVPAKTPLQSFFTENAPSTPSHEEFSILSWNILLPNSQDNWWNHKMYASWVPMDKRKWSHRQTLIRERLLLSGADIVCIQEADGDTFEKDFDFMKEAGYEYCLHKKYRFRCATFFKKNKFVLEQDAHKDRTLVTALRSNEGNRVLNVVNCHLSGGAAPERRLRQVYEALEQVRKWKAKAELTLQKQRKANRPSPKNILKAEESLQLQENAGIIVCGDFNSDGNTGVRRLLVEGSIDPEWHEPQYPHVTLTSKRKEHSLGHPFVDAAELAYTANVCDGDYGERPTAGCRPATYVVPNLASLLLLPIDGEQIPRTQFGQQVARGLADTLGLHAFCESEIDKAFESIDLDGNNFIDEDEIQNLLESAYVATYGKQIEAAKKNFISGFCDSVPHQTGLSREQLTEKLMALKDELEGVRGNGDISQKVARGLADTLGLRAFCKSEIDRAFDSIDVDGNNLIDELVQMLLESTYVAAYGKQIENHRREFFSGFRRSATGETGLSREQLTEKLLDLQQELEGGCEGAELVEVRTEADAQRMINRFSPILRSALDLAFFKFSSDGESLTETEVETFLVMVNGQLGRGGTSRHTAAAFKRKIETAKPAILTRQDWYGVFARELGEGKWWQVVYDLEACGANLRPHAKDGGQHYQGWLDYIYFDSQRLACTGLQEALTAAEVSRVYDHGDALPNEWYPSDHLPVAALFSWQSMDTGSSRDGKENS